MINNKLPTWFPLAPRDFHISAGAHHIYFYLASVHFLTIKKSRHLLVCAVFVANRLSGSLTAKLGFSHLRNFLYRCLKITPVISPIIYA